MRLHDSAREERFLETFDARFPYCDEENASALIREGATISLNAAFCVLNEICRPPLSKAVTKDRQHELLEEWAEAVRHELVALVLPCAQVLIKGDRLPWTEAVEVMERVGEYDAQRAALNIVYFSGDCDDKAGDVALNLAHSRIRARWEKIGI
ncbi:hypothetical protein [Altererythrobacter sp.]|uniref:hypothetical protein n=1 Tax=Altererythrobacter sp. TaxID=1872480 RepID=UPI003D07763C